MPLRPLTFTIAAACIGLTGCATTAPDLDAAALALMRVDEAERAGATPLAIIRDYVTVAGAPSRFSVMPIEAIRKLLDRVGG